MVLSLSPPVSPRISNFLLRFVMAPKRLCSLEELEFELSCELSVALRLASFYACILRYLSLMTSEKFVSASSGICYWSSGISCAPSLPNRTRISPSTFGCTLTGLVSDSLESSCKSMSLSFALTLRLLRGWTSSSSLTCLRCLVAFWGGNILFWRSWSSFGKARNFYMMTLERTMMRSPLSLNEGSCGKALPAC